MTLQKQNGKHRHGPKRVRGTKVHSKKSSIWETLTLLSDSDRSTNTIFFFFFSVMLKCRWSAVEVSLKWRWNTIEVQMRFCWSAVEVLTDNSHCHRPHPANSPIIHSKLVQNLEEKNGPTFWLKIVSSQANIKNMFFEQRSPKPRHRVFCNGADKHGNSTTDSPQRVKSVKNRWPKIYYLTSS